MIEERTEVYRIVTERTELIFTDMDQQDLAPAEVNDESRMRNAGWARPEVVDELWTQKNRMDGLFDEGKGDMYYKLRDQKFPQDRKGSAKFANRAGDKLWQVHCAVDDTLFDPLPPASAFFDICGGPGAFSQLLLDKFSEMRCGFGMTLRIGMTASNDYWYRALERHERFHILWGADDQGDVYVPANLASAAEAVKNELVSIVVSDGGFKIQKLDDKHMENLQELFSGRIILSEFTLALNITAERGHFVVKLFDSFSHLTVSLIYIASLCFEEVYIVKPVKSRIVNSERYLAAKRRKPDSPTTRFCTELLNHLHARIYDFMKDRPNEHFSPLSAIPVKLLQEDSVFVNCITAMNEELGQKQSSALKEVMDAVDESLKHVRILEARAARFAQPQQASSSGY
jgi:cap1 methyltransferase